MKFKLFNFITLFGCSLVLLYSCSQTKQDNHKPTTYYFNPITGSNSNTGTDQKSAFKSFSKLNEIHLNPGDQVLLANNTTFQEPLLLKNIKGTKDKKIIFSNYTLPNTSISQRAIIDIKDVLNGISITDCSFIEIKNIRISASASSNNSTTSKYCDIFNFSRFTFLGYRNNISKRRSNHYLCRVGLVCGPFLKSHENRQRTCCPVQFTVSIFRAACQYDSPFFSYKVSNVEKD